MTPLAGVCLFTGDWDRVMPWHKVRSPVEDFHSHKVHPIIKNWETVMGKIMAAKTYNFLRNQGVLKTNIAWDDILNFENNSDPHHLIEGHLPSIVPLSFVKKLVVPEDLFKQLDQEQVKRLSILLNDEKKQKLLIYGSKADPMRSLSQDKLARLKDVKDTNG